MWFNSTNYSINNHSLWFNSKDYSIQNNTLWFNSIHSPFVDFGPLIGPYLVSIFVQVPNFSILGPLEPWEQFSSWCRINHKGHIIVYFLQIWSSLNLIESLAQIPVVFDITLSCCACIKVSVDWPFEFRCLVIILVDGWMDL